MRRHRGMLRLVRLLSSLAAAVAMTVSSPRALAAQARQTEADEYTRYELLEPGSAKFRIVYEVTATTAGATYFFNPIRKGSVASNESVSDRATGKPLVFDVVGAAVARDGGVRSQDTTQTYIRVKLTHPVPPDGGQARLLIDKTYEDASSYFLRGDTIVFNRPLGIKRNAVVLPKGYELVSSNFPSQVLQESDGRIGITFWNNTPAEAPLAMRAVRVGEKASAAMKSSVASRLDDRAHQNRDIVYFLRQPETHAFDLYHDYTESRPGTSTYINEVRAGSTVSSPRAMNLDTGEPLTFEILKGEAIARARLAVSNVTPDLEVVVFHFAPVKPGESIRVRMFETYTDTARYKVVNDELVWDRSFGRPSNAVVLPAGWVLTNSAIPATVSTLPDGRVRLDFINPRPDEVATLITARRR